MRVFVTGATGWVGSAVVRELLETGHEVVGLARSDASAVALTAAGAGFQRGTLEDLDVLRAGADAADGVVHTGFIHDWANFAAACAVDQRAVETLGGVLEGSDRPLVIASGVTGWSPGRVLTEADAGDPATAGARALTENILISLADRGVRSSAVRLAPTVHGTGDAGFVPTLIGLARERGVSAYVGDGSNRWPAVHRDDAAHLFCLALQSAPAGSRLHAVAEQGVPYRAIAEAIGRGLDVPVAGIDAAAASAQLGFLGAVVALDMPASSTATRELLGWKPTGPELLADLAQGPYFATVPV